MVGTLANVLVVDDILANRKLAGKILCNEFAVDTVKSGEEALDFFTRKIPDLVLLDIYMEGIDGFEVLEKMLAVPATAGIPVIFLTADDDPEVETKGLKAGAVDFITKPFIAAIMLQRVRRAIELSHLQHQLQQEVEQKTQRIQKLSLQLIQVLVNTLEARDKKLNGHSRRVADLAWEIARRMGKPQQEKESMYYMGLLHNIGKIAIPDEVLNKKDKLTGTEQEIVQQSVVIGADILKNVTELPDLWQVVRSYKENYDGSGYPDGLRGRDIAEGARIVGAACAYDTLHAPRKNLSQAEIMQALTRMRGTRLDPEVVDILLKMEEKNNMRA